MVIEFLTITGSHACNAATRQSDIDLIGFAVPPQAFIFPERAGYVRGFGTKPPEFTQVTEHKDGEDITIYNVVKFLELCRRGNPNTLESLYQPYKNIQVLGTLGQRVLDSRDLFLSQRCYNPFKGFAKTAMRDVVITNPDWPKKTYLAARILMKLHRLLTEGTLLLHDPNNLLRSLRDEKLEFASARLVVQDLWDDVCILQERNGEALPKEPDSAKLTEVLRNWLMEYYQNESCTN